VLTFSFTVPPDFEHGAIHLHESLDPLRRGPLQHRTDERPVHVLQIRLDHGVGKEQWDFFGIAHRVTIAGNRRWRFEKFTAS
jgi:hypothetical protein